MKPKLQKWALLFLILGCFSKVLFGQNKPNNYFNGAYQEYYLKADGLKHLISTSLRAPLLASILVITERKSIKTGKSAINKLRYSASLQ